MPSSSLETFAAWSNYHLTLGEAPDGATPPSMTIRHLRRLHASDVADMDVPDAIGATAAMLMDVLHDTQVIREKDHPFFGPRGDFASGIVGRGWSFTQLIGTPVSQIIAEGLSWSKLLPEDLRTPGAKGRNLCVCGGGTRLRELVSWAEALNPPLSIPTSGTHLGPSVAGGFGTASHGSRLGMGGLHNLVRAMHIVTGEGDHVFLHRKSDPIFTQQAIAQLEVQFSGRDTGDGKQGQAQIIACYEIDDDKHFDNALIHLGCMGIVNAVILELTEKEEFSVMIWDHPIDKDTLDLLSDGQFDKVVDAMGADGRKPQFYELTIDRFEWDGSHAAHLIYFNPDEEITHSAKGRRPVPSEGIFALAQGLASSEARWAQLQNLALDPPGPSIQQAIRFMLDREGSAFAYYLREGKFTKPDPNDFTNPKIRGSWGQIHADEITGEIPGALYNASFAIDRKDLATALPSICDAVRDLAPTFVFTVRFVSDANQGLSFIQDPNAAVIEIDGLSPFFCLRVLEMLKLTPLDEVHFTAALQLLSTTLQRGALAVKRGLHGENIDFAMHWAKLGDQTQDLVRQNFGHPNNPKSALASWRATREEVLSTKRSPKGEGRVFFRNAWVEELGLLAPI